MNRNGARQALLLSALSIGLIPAAALGQEASTTEWNAGGNGNWSDTTWTAGVPGTGSLAGVLTGDTVAVAIPAANDLSQILVNGDSVLDINSTIGVVGTDTPATGFYIVNGTTNVNSGGVLDVNTGGVFRVGNGGEGFLNLLPGGTITTDRPFVVGSATSTSSLFSQTGGTLTHTAGEFRIGNFDGVGTYEISGGIAAIDTMKVGYAGSGTGFATVSGSADLTLNGETSISWDAECSGTLQIDGGTVVTNGRIRVGVAGTSPVSGTRSATLNQTDGDVTVNGRIDIGGNTPADMVNTVTLSGGQLSTTESVNVGYSGPGTGILNVSDLSFFQPQNLIISNGAETTGTVNLTGGTTAPPGEVTVGPNSAVTSTAILNISEDGYLETDNFRIRNGTVNQSGEFAEVFVPSGGGGFLLGVDSSGDTVYNLSDGIVTSETRVRVGVACTGTTLFNQTGGDVNITGRLDVGENAGTGVGDNVYQISSGTLMASDRGLIGAFGTGHATLSVSGDADVDFAANIEVGRADTTGVVNVSGGVLTGATMVLGQDKVGGDSLGQGSLNVSDDGLLELSGLQVRKGIATQMDGTSTVTVSGDVIVGLNNQADATFDMQDGLLDVNGRLRLGAGSGSVTNLFDQGGGTVDLNSRLDLGDADTATNRYAISGGTLSLTGGDQRILVGFQDNTSGQLDVSGTGLVQASSVVLGEFPLATGTLNLDGGVIETTQIKSGNAPGSAHTFNLNGGTIRSSADASVNIDGNLPATMLAGGVTFDVPDAGWTTSTSGIMTGAGALAKIGPGKLIVNGVQAYTGATRVEEGTLCLVEPYLDSNGDVYLYTGATLELQFAGANDIGTLFIDDVPQPVGTYSNAETALITGTGSLNATVGGAAGTLEIVSISRAGNVATIVIKGEPNSDYDCRSSLDLTGFGAVIATETTDGNGDATFTVDATEDRKFYIIEDAP